MQRLIFVFSLALVLFALPAAAQEGGIEFEKGSWEEVLAKAKEENKVIFVDAYATWCGPCKYMSYNIFPMKEVGAYYNANFINYKYDMEKGTGPGFANKYKVSAYPTFLFIDGDGNVVHRAVGGRQADALIALGEEALGKSK